MENRTEMLNRMGNDEVHVCYNGPFENRLLSVMAKNVEIALSEHPAINKKVFKIFVELAQNLALYSIEREELGDQGIGTFVIKEFKDHYIFATGNKVTNETAEKIIVKCDKINSLNREELREFKRELRSRAVSESGGGNIGLIQVALTSNNKLQYKTIDTGDGKVYYIVASRIDKKQSR